MQSLPRQCWRGWLASPWFRATGDMWHCVALGLLGLLSGGGRRCRAPLRHREVEVSNGWKLLSLKYNKLVVKSRETGSWPAMICVESCNFAEQKSSRQASLFQRSRSPRMRTSSSALSVSGTLGRSSSRVSAASLCLPAYNDGAVPLTSRTKP